MGCESLENVTVPNSIKTIGLDVFGSCTNLKTIRYMGTKKEWNKIEFSDKGFLGSKNKKEFEKIIIFE